MFLEQIVGSKSKIKILRVLTDVRRAYTLELLHKESGLSKGILSTTLNEMVSVGILTKMKGKRKERLFTFNTSSPYAQIIVQLFAIEKLQERKNVVLLNVWTVLESSLQKIKDKIELMVLFGSHSRGESTVESDIDLFIVPKASISISLLKDELHTIDKRISPLIMNEETFFSDVKEQTPLYLNIKKEGILIFISESLKNNTKSEHFLDAFKGDKNG